MSSRFWGLYFSAHMPLLITIPCYTVSSRF
jgi:hypothetical protein